MLIHILNIFLYSIIDFIDTSGFIYSSVANLAIPSLYINILKGSQPDTNTYNLKSNFNLSINKGLFIYFYTITF